MLKGRGNREEFAGTAKEGSANAAVESDSESEGVFVVESDGESVPSDSRMPELESVTSSGSFGSSSLENPDFEEGDWFSCGDCLDVPEPILVAAEPGQSSYARAEVYDSGCTKHISPYRHDLRNFTEIPPKSFRANGADISQLQLTEVLYSPEVGYTLVSIGKLDENGFSVTFSGGKCVLKGPDGSHVGEVPKTPKGP